MNSKSAGFFQGSLVNSKDLAASTSARHRPRSVLKCCLPGEFLAMMLVVHAAFGSVIWGISAVQAPERLWMIAVGAWIVLRGAGGFAGRSLNILVTVGLLCSLLFFKQQHSLPPFAAYAIFSLPIFAMLLVMIAGLDLVELFVSPMGSKIGFWLMRLNWYRIAIWLFVLAFLIYMVIVPISATVFESLRPAEQGRDQQGLTLMEQFRIRSTEAMMALIFFAVGASIGSFLNVVVFRLPRHESIIFRPSSCPGCQHKIEGRDNIPILGWLLLNGKCRNCRAPISTRYPLVESIAALIFITFYFVELISGGDNIPVRPPNLYRGVVWIILYTKWDLVSLYFFHCFALSILLTWALIDIDRQRIREDELHGKSFQPVRIPWSRVIGLCAMFCAALLWMPSLLPVPWQFDKAFGNEASRPLSSLGAGVTGGLVGATLGWLAVLATSRAFFFNRSGDLAKELKEGDLSREIPEVSVAQKDELELARGDFGLDESDRQGEVGQSLGEQSPFELNIHAISAGLIIGLSVGWQATIGVWILAFALRPVVSLVARGWQFNEPPFTAFLLAAYFIHLIGWRWLDVYWWPSRSATEFGWSLAAISLVILWGFNRALPIKLWLQPQALKQINPFESHVPMDDLSVNREVVPGSENTLQTTESETLSQTENDPAEGVEQLEDGDPST